MQVYHSLVKKGPWAVHITLCSDRGVGGYLEHRCILPRKNTHVYIITTYIKILHTPTQYKLNSS